MSQPQTNLKTGLTNQQVQEQFKLGNTNEVKKRFGGPWIIIKNNTLTLFNLINVVLAALIFETGSYRNMLFLVIAIANTVIGTFQELRSKRKIDQLALLSQSKPRVIRDGKVQTITLRQIVQGDLIKLTLGDQVPVDGKIVETKDLEVDESQITGEANSITKKVNDQLTSGSHIVSGHGVMLATAVGKASFVNRITQKARQGGDQTGEMLRSINRIIKILTIIIIPLGMILFASKYLRGNDIDKSILGTTAAMIGMIPEGLVLLSSVTMAVSAMKLARKRVLVRNLPAIESLARVDTICLDKTGTLTSGKLTVQKLIDLEFNDQSQLAKLVGNAIATIGDDNPTADALKKAFPGQIDSNASTIAFSSDRKWSGAQFKQQNLIIGAPQFINAQLGQQLNQQIQAYAEQGYRVLTIAQSDGKLATDLPTTKIIGLILLTDEIRPNAKRTLSYLRNQDITINVISGDDPRTVSQIAKQVNIPGADQWVDMSQIKQPDFKSLVQNYHVFGRVTPPQKSSLIQAYQELGHDVAMTGDGVNDILALKQSNCGIALATGNESTQSVANFVLVDSDFDAMIPVLKEGRRVINNISSVASLYLIKTMYSLLLSILFIFASRDYPFQPIQLTPISTFMIGIPSFILAFEPNFERVKDQFYAKIKQIAVPAAVCIVGYVLAITFLGHFIQFKFSETSTLSVLATGIICWLALLAVNQPLNRFKTTVTILTGGGFLLLFFVFGKAFLLTNLDRPILMIMGIIIALSAIPYFKGMRWITKYVLNVIQLKKVK